MHKRLYDKLMTSIGQALDEAFKSQMIKDAVNDFGGIRNANLGDRELIPTSELTDDDLEDRVYTPDDEDYDRYNNSPYSVVFNNGNYIHMKPSSYDKYDEWGRQRELRHWDFQNSNNIGVLTNYKDMNMLKQNLEYARQLEHNTNDSGMKRKWRIEAGIAKLGIRYGLAHHGDMKGFDYDDAKRQSELKNGNV